MNIKWDIVNENRLRLVFNEYFHVRNPPLYIISIDNAEANDKRNDDVLFLDGPIDQFLSKYYLINSTFDLPAAVNENIYLGALRHLKREIMIALNIRLVISGYIRLQK